MLIDPRLKLAHPVEQKEVLEGVSKDSHRGYIGQTHQRVVLPSGLADWAPAAAAAAAWSPGVGAVVKGAGEGSVVPAIAVSVGAGAPGTAVASDWLGKDS